MYLYNFADFCSMIADENRMNGFVKALQQSVKPDSVVLDIGAGTGIFSLLACRFGAKKVYSIEPNLVIHVAREMALANGFSERIEFIENLSTNVELPEKADILICDLRGNLPIFESGISSILDARQRLLKENAVMIPRKDTIYAALVESEETIDAGINKLSQTFFDFKSPSAKRLLTNRIINARGKRQEIISNTEVFAVLDYATLENGNFRKQMAFNVEKAGIAHGVRAWFVGELGDNAIVTNSPTSPEIIYGAPIFPFENTVAVEIGDIIKVDLQAKFEHGDYLWTWDTEVFSAKGEQRFQNSTLAGMIISPSGILKQSEFYRPQLHAEAEIDKFVLNLIDGEKMSGDIADALLEKFPEKFVDFQEALVKVAELSQKYCD